MCKSLQESDLYFLGTESNFDKFFEIDDALKFIFIRGLFDKKGYIINEDNDIVVGFRNLTDGHKLNDIVSFINMPFSKVKSSSRNSWRVGGSVYKDIFITDESSYNVEWSGLNGLDLLGKIYGNAKIYDTINYSKYLEICSTFSGINKKLGPLFKWCKIDDRAVAPSKVRISDSGFDLTIIDVHKKISDVTTVYTTGIKIQAMAHGWYFDMVPRSSIIKTGHILANMVGVIDRAYTGPILIALTKVDPKAKDLELPMKIAQLIPRPIVHGEIIQVDDLDETDRGQKGFGSTGK